MKWEYKVIERKRDCDETKEQCGASTWLNSEPLDLNLLGAAGWELVSVVPGSGFHGPIESGFTSEQTWIFKRPFEERKIDTSSVEDWRQNRNLV